MADDGLLMNFSVGPDPLQIRSVFKGGRWRDRLDAKKSSQRWQRKLQANGAPKSGDAAPATTNESTVEAEESRPAKRQKLDGIAVSHPSHHNVLSKPREVVSSLFTYNPKSQSKYSVQTQSQENVTPKPSNAPLPASVSPFLSLGLSPFLSTHLTQSLHLTAPTAIQKATISKLLGEDSDAFIQAETGSGKTLAYLLPIVQRIMALSTETSKINRSSGLFALILAPTRELTHQISAVLTRLLRPLPHLVAGTVTGGSTKNHEKSKLRKGLNILIATPGRLADHLEHTEVLDVGNVRWLVLDEGDRLMELGFEEEVKAIVKKLDDQMRGKRGDRSLKVTPDGLPERRTTVLCSATMKMGVQRLGEIILKDAVHIKVDPATTSDSEASLNEGKKGEDKNEKPFSAPAQLKQSCIITPPKQRLVTLAATLKHSFARKGSIMKAIVFLSCADSVGFHFEVFARKDIQPSQDISASDQNYSPRMKSRKAKTSESSPGSEETSKATAVEKEKFKLSTMAPASTLASTPNPIVTIYALHGSLEQKLRTATLQSFTKCTDPSILLCTDVASRGLDLPNIDMVIEYDPPFSTDDHLHRVGRTARAGKEGRACCFLMPGEEEGYVSVLKECSGEGLVKSENAEDVLRKGFAGSKNAAAAGDAGKWDEKATEWQLEVERWVIDDNRAGEMARKAFTSHVRAYATHVAKERAMFDVKALHLGHLAKAFALRERPGNMGRGNHVRNDGPSKRKGDGEKRVAAHDGDGDDDDDPGIGRQRTRKSTLDIPVRDEQDGAKRMRAKMKEHMNSIGEFNIG